MTLDLYPYQQSGADWLSSAPQALLADEMGLGKSAQVIRACDMVQAKNILVICPAAVRINWDREFARFSPMDRPSTVIETGKDQPKPGVNVVSYDLVASNEKLRAALKAMDWCVLVLDEAHYLKDRTARRTKAIYGHNKFPGLAHKAKRVWRLTGTPIPNNASELYTHLKSAGIERRSYWDFVFDFCTGFQGDYGYKITGTKNEGRLKQMLAQDQFMLRRKKDDVLKQLPEITLAEVTVPRGKVELDPWFYENYHGIGVPAFLQKLEEQDKTLKASLMAIREGHHAGHADAVKLLESYAKSTATLRRYIGLAKLQACLDIIEEELASGQIEKIVLFAMHMQVIEQTRLRLKQFRPVTLYGATPAAKRQAHIDAFQNDAHTRVFIGQVVAAGAGINLTRAKEVAFLETSWVPAQNAQAVMRIHRIGQTRACRARFFTCAGSVDEQVMRVLVHKTREISKIID